MGTFKIVQPSSACVSSLWLLVLPDDLEKELYFVMMMKAVVTIPSELKIEMRSVITDSKSLSDILIISISSYDYIQRPLIKQVYNITIASLL